MADLNHANGTCTSTFMNVGGLKLQIASPDTAPTVTRTRVFRSFFYTPCAVKPRNLRDVIAKLRASPEGETVWSLTLDQKDAERELAMRMGSISKIRFYRMRARKTQKQLAIAIGTHQSDVARYERVSYRASRRTLEKIAHALGIGVAELL